jgi:hypothetical protein
MEEGGEDTLTAEQLEEQRKRTEADAQLQIHQEKVQKAFEAAVAGAKAQLRRCQEMVRSAAVGRRAQVSILMSEGAVPNFMFQVIRAFSRNDKTDNGILITVTRPTNFVSVGSDCTRCCCRRRPFDYGSCTFTSRGRF